MIPLNQLTGQYWWCLQHSLDTCHVARFTFSKNKIILQDSFAGSLSACHTFMEQKQSSMDGVLVADDSMPVRLLSGADYTLQCNDAAAPFLPGVAWADLHVVQGISIEDPVILCQKKACESLLEKLTSHGFCVSRVVPLSLLHMSMLNIDTARPSEAFVRKTEHFRDIWIFHAGEFKGYFRISGNDHSADVFFQEFLPRRFPGAETPAIQESLFQFSGIPAELSSLAFLARETVDQGVEISPTLGGQNDEIARARRNDSLILRRFLKLCVWLSAFAVALLIVSWLIATAYGLYTRSDRADYEKRVDLDKELRVMSQNLERQRDAMTELLKHRTRHAAKMSALIEGLPPNLWLTRWDVQGIRHSFQGLAEDGEAISHLLTTLEKSPQFRQVRLRTTEKTTWQGRPVIRFDMAAEERE